MGWSANPPRGGEALWLQQLHSLGLLNGSFRPEAKMGSWPADRRQRAELIQHGARHILHMHKARQPMNLQLHQVLSDITGVSGPAILPALVAGQPDPKVLASFGQPGCQAEEATIIKALTGTWRQEHLFGLGQSLAMYDASTQQIVACDAQIERQFAAVNPPGTPRTNSPSCLRSSPAPRPRTNPPQAPARNCFVSAA